LKGTRKLENLFLSTLGRDRGGRADFFHQFEKKTGNDGVRKCKKKIKDLYKKKNGRIYTYRGVLSSAQGLYPTSREETDEQREKV